MGVVSELRRRNVIKVAVAYGVVTWVLIQVAETTFPILKLPEWSVTLVTVLLLIGFPLALIFAWAFELTPEGIKLERHVDRSQSITHLTGRKFDYVIIAVLALALGYFAFDKFVLDTSREAELVQSTTEPVTEQPAKSGDAEVADKSIAVLPFLNRSAVADDAYFVDGIHDDILTQLAKISSFDKVISRTSMEQYRETDKAMPQIGRELGVTTILEGGVQRAGNQVRINVQLIEAATDKHLWAETYDRQLTVENIFLVQAEIAREVAKALSVTLIAEEDNRLAKVPTDSLDAYRLYHLGKQETYKRTVESLERAEEYFEGAIRTDPEYAQAYAGLARTYLLSMYYSDLSTKDVVRKSKPLVERAIQLDPTLADGYVARSGVNSLDRRWAAAESDLETAIALNHSHAWARTQYGFLLKQLGRFDESVMQYEEAARLSPRDPLVHAFLGEAYLYARRVQDALESLHDALDLDPDHPRIYEALGDVYNSFLGRQDAVVKWYMRGLERDPNSVRLRAFLTFSYLNMGDAATARLLTEQQIGRTIRPKLGTTRLKLALLVYSGQYDEALQFAEEQEQSQSQQDSNPFVLFYLEFLYHLNGEYQRALKFNDRRIELYEDIPHPETKVTDFMLSLAISRAAILMGMGENLRAQRLLNNCLEYAKTAPQPRFGVGVNFELVHVYTLLGDTPNALLALRQAIDAKVRRDWWFELLHHPVIAPLRNEPVFHEMVEEIRADMAAQLANVREMQRTGEIPPLPVVNH